MRFDSYNYTTKYTDDTTPETTSLDTSKADIVLPRLGLVYLPVPELSLYASYSQGFNPNTVTLELPAGRSTLKKAPNMKLVPKQNYSLVS